MMNHHMPAGPGQPHISPALPLHPNRGRHSDYHSYHQQQPQSPVHPHPYPSYHQLPYYAHPPQVQYPLQRWHAPYAQQQQQQHYVPPPPPLQAYQPRSPMVVSSQPHASPITPNTRHQALSNASAPLQSSQSPRLIPQYNQLPVHAASPTSSSVNSQKVEAKSGNPPTTPNTKHDFIQNPLALPPEHREPYWPQLPWYSVPESCSAFPTRVLPRRRRKRPHAHVEGDSVALPSRTREGDSQGVSQGVSQTHAAGADEHSSETSTVAARSEPETPATSQAPSESDVTQVSTPTTPAHASSTSPKPPPIHQQPRRDTRTAIAVPNIPALSRGKDPQTLTTPAYLATDQISDLSTPKDDLERHSTGANAAEPDNLPQTPPPKSIHKSWADLVRQNKPLAAGLENMGNGETFPPGPPVSKSASIAEVLAQYNVQNDSGLSFLEPRGLVNTGNMCYMNSILIFCVPFHKFLDQVRQRTIYSMKSDTPLLDAMIMFTREFKVLDTADSVDVLRKTLKLEHFEAFGDPITPDYVYDVIRVLPRFSGMRRGHQQDAEEFLGFLLEGLHDECVQVIQGQELKLHPSGSPPHEENTSPQDGWLEVGPKQKAAITREAGADDASSPITKIFGGKLRSELRVPGLKDSVTFEPYKPLQLDIGAPQVNNIVDALKGLTRTESLSGDFGGKGNIAKKQVFIDTLPPVLILHLKRFQYDNSFSGTQKIWKKVGYPLELQIPKEVLPPAKRGSLAANGGPPHYRLTSVVYHHGKSAAGGHYTVDVLRQDNREWVRMDDTVIRRIRPEDVAEGGAEEDPKVLAKTLEQHRADADLQSQRNMYKGLDDEEASVDEEKPWSEVNNNVNGHAKKWSGVAVSPATPNGVTGGKSPVATRQNARDKVAYILLYERIRP